MNETLEQIAEICWEDAERHINIWASDREEMVRAEFARRLVAELTKGQEPYISAHWECRSCGYEGETKEHDRPDSKWPGTYTPCGQARFVPDLYAAPIPATCPTCTQMIDDAAKSGRIMDDRDGERYRWLKENRDVMLLTSFFGNGCVNRTVEEVDAYIDDVRAAAPEYQP